jgi:phosphopantothenoylcysteine decarboxylase/phosphopantothenate--cysteine ligase, prokaryotic
MNLKGKTIVLGVTGSIAAYKIANLASSLVKLEADVHVVMTANAQYFINSITFETLTGNKCLTDTFDRNFQFHVTHVSLAQKADVIMVAPATANIIGKMANGIADDMLSTMILAAKCPILVSPAMNTQMYRNPAVQDNINKLKSFGFQFIEPAVGRLACASVGEGKLPDENVLLENLLLTIAFEKDLKGKKVLVTAGPTREAIDPVRFITNGSTGKMGYAIARAAMLRGADVTLISGPTGLEKPLFITVQNVQSARQMKEAVSEAFSAADILIMTAAVADFTPASFAENKIKKQGSNELDLHLVATTDILKHLATKNNRIKLFVVFQWKPSICLKTQSGSWNRKISI